MRVPLRSWLLFPALLLACAAGAQQPASALPETTDILLHTELSARTLPPGERLLAGVQLRNVSGHNIQWVVPPEPVSPLYLGFRVELTTLEGEPVAMRRPGQTDLRRVIRTAGATLVPDEEQMVVFDISNLFDLARPGNYVVRISHTRDKAIARSVPVVFSIVEGAKPDARRAAVADPYREAATAVQARLTANAPVQVRGPTTRAIARLQQPQIPLTARFTLANLSGKPVRPGFHTWVRMEVEHPDGRTEQVFGRGGRGDWNQLLNLGPLAPQRSVEFETNVWERFTFPGAGNYTLRFWFPRAKEAATLPVTVTDYSALSRR